MVEYLKDNIAISGLVGFFLFIGLFQVYQNSVYRTTLPMVWVDDFTLEEKQQIKKSIEWQLLAWQLDHRRAAFQTRIEIVRYPFPNEEGQLLHGRYMGERIVVYAGERMEVPAFYHELCHYLDEGNKHSDPRWPVWRQRNRDLCQFILMSRSQPQLVDLAQR